MLSAGRAVMPSEVLAAVRERTNALLGRTISYTEADWAAPTRLPGWTRSHVAAHLIANARGLLRVARALTDGGRVPMYESDESRTRELELGALADGLSLQIGLDQTAGELQDVLAGLVEMETPVTLRPGLEVPARALPLVRLHEVVLHHFDLEPEAPAIEGMEPRIANRLLAHEAGLISQRPDVTAVELVADEGFSAVIGTGEQQAQVAGPAAALLAWVARGVESPALIARPTA